MNIAVCFKYVIDEADITVNAADGSLKMERASRKISDYDRNAIEEGARWAKESGGTMTVVSAGSAAIKTGFKDALSRGADSAIYICNEAFENASSATIAKSLAAVLEKGGYNLIIFGEGSSDMYSQQVGPRVAELLGLPTVTFVNSITIDGNKLTAERKLEDEVEIICCELPAVVTILDTINKPKIPGMKQIIDAKKKPLHELTIEELGIAAEELRMLSAEESKVEGIVSDRKRIIFGGSPGEAAAELVNVVLSQGLIK